MLTTNNTLPLYCLLDDTYFAPLDARDVSPHYRELLQRLLPGWAHHQQGIWLRACQPETPMPEQGWKVHVSVMPTEMPRALEHVAKVCGPLGITFKALVDERMVRQSVTQMWPRSQSGKCIAIYPPEHELQGVLDALDAAFLGITPGPYVLSDAPYGASRCVFYRYGAFRSITKLNPDGTRTFLIRDPGGRLVEDSRMPWFSPPSWTTCPVARPPTQKKVELALHDGRFRVTGALKFTNGGGVYEASDRRTGEAVIIKEARPGVLNPSGTIPLTSLLRREHEMLKLLSGTGVTAEPVELFEESNHVFLVISRIEHDLHLGALSTSRNPVYTKEPNTAAKYVRDYMAALIGVAEAMQVVHQHGIVMGDLSFTNVLCGSDRIHVIDFGGAFRPGIDPAPLIMTPGLGGGGPQDSFERDIRAFGYLVVGMFVLPSGLSEMSARAPVMAARRVATILADSEWLIDLAERCLAHEGRDLSFAEIAQQLRMGRYHEPSVAISAPLPPDRRPGLVEESDPPLERPGWRCLLDQVLASATPGDTDSLYRCDPQAYERNPLAFAWGASGILHVMAATETKVPDDHMAWWDEQVNRLLPPGLYTGSAGAAIAAATLGRLDTHQRLLLEAIKAQSVSDDTTLFQGAAGVAVACAHAYQETLDESWLVAASRLTETIGGPKRYGAHRPLGVALGDAGRALAFAAMFKSDGDRRWFDSGRAFLIADLVETATTPAGYLSCRSSTAPEDANIYRPYWYDGSAGLLSACATWVSLTGDDEVAHWMVRLFEDCTRLMTSMPGLMCGLAGMGMALLDAYHVVNDNDLLESAEDIASSLGVFVVPAGPGVRIAGDQCVRAAADVGTGAAGVAAFLWRVEQPDRPNLLPGFDVPVALSAL